MNKNLPMSMMAMALALSYATGIEAAPHKQEAVYRAALGERAAVLDLLKEIVDIDSGTGDAAGGAKVEAVIARELKALGAEIRS